MGLYKIGEYNIVRNLAAPQCNIAIGSRTQQPRLSRNPTNGQNTKAIFNPVASEDFEWDDKWVCHEVVVHARMEYLYRAVVGRGCEEGVGGVEM